MRLRYRIPLALLAILMVITLFIASSYALWKVTIYQETENIIETGCFKLDFEDVSSSIQLDNTYPMPDESGMKLKPYIFTISNTCTIDAKYTLFLNTLDVDKEKLDDGLIKYSIVKSDGALAVADTLNAAPKNIDTSHFTFDKKILTSYEIGSGTLKGRTSKTSEDGETATYSLRLWIDESATNDIAGQTFEAGLSTIAYATKLAEESTTPEVTAES